jgi:serine/threonine-protein kinase RsbW
VVSVSHTQLSEPRPAVPECIGPLRRAVVGIAAGEGATERRLDDIALAVSEALTNVVRHAYPPGQPGAMTVHAGVEDDVLAVLVCDEGRGMPEPSDEPRSGLGLLIIARVTQSLELKDAAPGVALRMAFRLG